MTKREFAMDGNENIFSFESEVEEEVSINAFAEMRNIIQKAIKEQGLTASDVKKMLEDDED